MLGNHKYYRGHMIRTQEKIRSACLGPHVQVLERDSFVIGGTRFLGATMWTDFSAKSNKYLASITLQSLMNDYRRIREGENFRRIKPGDLAAEALKQEFGYQTNYPSHFQGQQS